LHKAGKFKVLVVDDDKDILDLLQYNLEKEGYQVETIYDAREAVQVAEAFHPDLILLDIMMPHHDGIDICRQIREKDQLQDIAILFLTARVEEYTEVAAFGAGGDDYIIKPIRPRALLMRIKATLERKSKDEKPSNRIDTGSLVIDRPSYSVHLNGELLKLARKEFELLYYLADNPNQVINRDKLLAKIWGTDVQVLPRTVDVHIRKIREKIGMDYIKTIKGVGYKFDSEL
jgi:two-component system alkaline phosphatase synthesis response regulator PhoP